MFIYTYIYVIDKWLFWLVETEAIVFVGLENLSSTLAKLAYTSPDLSLEQHASFHAPTS